MNITETISFDSFCEVIDHAIRKDYLRLILIGSVGRWNGTFNGYKRIHCASEIFGSCEEFFFTINNKNHLEITMCHHDGRHHMSLLAIRDNVSEDRVDDTLYEFTHGEKDVDDLLKSVLKSFDFITFYKNLYGWKHPLIKKGSDNFCEIVADE